MKNYPKKQVDNVIFVRGGRNINGYNRFEKEFHDLSDNPTKTDQRMNYQTPVWLDDIIGVPRGTKKNTVQFYSHYLGNFKKSDTEQTWKTRFLSQRNNLVPARNQRQRNETEYRKDENHSTIKAPYIKWRNKIIPLSHMVKCKTSTHTFGKNWPKQTVINEENAIKMERKKKNQRKKKKIVTEVPCVAHFASISEIIVINDAGRTGHKITHWQKQSDKTVRPIAFASRNSNDAEKNNSVVELELPWSLDKIRLDLYGKIVYLYTEHNALEPLIKRNRAYRQYSARLTKWLDRQARFDIWIQYTAENNLKLTDYLSRHPTEKASTDEIFEEYVIISLIELFKLNHKCCQLLKMARKIISTDQSEIMA